MKAVFTKKFWIGSISSAVIGTGIALACAGGYWEPYGNSNFTPELFVNTKYKPFFYAYDFYYEIFYDEDHNRRFNKQIVNDWRNYFDKHYSEPVLNYFLFQTTATTIDSILKGESFFPEVARNISLLKERKNKKESAFLNYLLLAKQCEQFALKKEDEVWYYDKKPEPRKSSAEICTRLKKEYEACKDKFIKPRLWFQYVRALFFNGDHKNCISAFESQVKFEKNTIYYRTMAYAAGAYYKNGDFAKSNYYYSLVYDFNDELKTVAHWSFKPQDEKDWQATLALCRNNEEKITLWQMLGIMYNDEIRSLYEIYKLDPSSEKLDLLLTRAVNKYENEKFNFYNEKKEAEIPKANKLKLFIQELVNNKTIAKPYMWRMALAYLEIIDGQYAFATEHLKEAERTLPPTELAKAQLKLLSFINNVSSLDKITSKEENELLADFTWLKNMQGDTTLPKFRRQQTYSWFINFMAKKYRLQKDLMKAEFFVTTSDYYVNEKQLGDMKTFLKKENKSPYEKLCEAIYALKYEDLVEFEAIYKTFNNKLDDAIALMEQAGAGAQKELLSNPFNGHIKDCHDCDHAQPQKTKFTKLSTLRKMKEMKDKLNTDKFNNALLLGNVFYSITYYGSSRLFYECNVIGHNGYSERDYINDAFRNKLTDMNMARTYYTIALSAAKTDEQKAKCFYMLAKCERNDWYNSGQGPSPGKDFIAWKNFNFLKLYSKTNYYKEVIKECGYFRTYTGN